MRTDRWHEGTLQKKPDHKQQKNKRKSYNPPYPKRLRKIDTIENGQHDTRTVANREREGGSGRLSQILIRGERAGT